MRFLLEGRNWTFTVVLPLRPREEVAASLAQHVLGEFLISLRDSLQQTFYDALTRQNLETRGEFIGRPQVRLELGPIVVWAVASSTDAELAARMALDRLALALTSLEMLYEGTVAAAQRASGVSWARTV